jgi:hypothetical protein
VKYDAILALLCIRLQVELPTSTLCKASVVGESTSDERRNQERY